jgi:hypothetical protein
MTLAVGLPRQRLADLVDRIVARPVARRFGPVDYGSDALADSASGLRLGQPDRRQRLENVGCLDLVNLAIAEGREDIGVQRIDPQFAMLSVLPGFGVLL